MKPAEVEFLCPECEERDAVEIPPGGVEWTCPACHESMSLRDASGDSPGAQKTGLGPIIRCAVCDCPKLYVQKDFNRTAGLIVVAITAIISGVVLMLTHSTMWAMLVLGLVTLADAAIYRFLPAVTVCYRCESVHRGYARNPNHEGFDIHTAEEFAYGTD